MKRFNLLCLTVCFVLAGISGLAQDITYDVMYSEYVSPSQSYIVQHPIDGEPQIVLTLDYPSAFDALLYSPLNGLYAIFDDQVYVDVEQTGSPLFYFPLMETVDHMREATINSDAYPDLTGTVMTHSATLSHNEQFIGLGMTTLDEMGRVVDEIVAIYHIESETLRIIEVKDPQLVANRSIDNLRWSPDDTILGYFYPTENLAASEHITLVTGCVADIETECQVERLMLPAEAPVMVSFDWSPDGLSIATSCASSHLDANDICILTAEGDFERLVETASDTYKYSLEWSPDGQWIAYAGQNLSHTQQDIYILNVETGEEINLSNTPDALESLPFWVVSEP